MIRKLALIGVLLGYAGVARAQVTISTAPGTAGNLTVASFDPENAVAPISVFEGPGVKVGEGTVLHPTAGLETGFISNVFYENTDPQGSGVLRVLAQLGISSLGGARLDPNSGGIGPSDDDDQTKGVDQGSLRYDASVRLAYDQMLSNNSTINSTGGLSAGVMVRGMVAPNDPLSFGFHEDFARLIRAANFETTIDENRDINNLDLTLLYHPKGHTLSGYLYYANTIDVFESDDPNYPDRFLNRIGVHPMWRWLPQTLVWGDLSQGLVTGIGSRMASQEKPTSYPLRAVVGISSLISLKTTVSADAGYTNGFYSRGPSWSSPHIDATVGYHYSPLGRVGIGYSLFYQDSVNANFYRDHLLRLYWAQGFEPFVLVVAPELHFREYNGVNITGAPPVRDDVIAAVVAGLHYTYRNWLAATIDYRFTTVQTDYRYMDATGGLVNPSYVRHELLAGLRIAM